MSRQARRRRARRRTPPRCTIEPRTPATRPSSPSTPVRSSRRTGFFSIKAADGTLATGIPLSFRIEQFQFPVDAEIHGRTATLRPSLDPSRAVYRPVALPFEDQAPWKTPYDREVAAFSRLRDTVMTGTAIGTTIGLVGGGVIGCIAGATVGAVVTGVLAELFGAGPLAGCLAGAALGAGIGAIGGALVVTGPIIIAAGIQYLITTNEPFVPPREPSGK